VFIGVHQWLIPFPADGISYTPRAQRALRLSEMRGFEFLPLNGQPIAGIYQLGQPRLQTGDSRVTFW